MAGAAQTRGQDQGNSPYQCAHSPGDTPRGQAEKLHQGPHQHEFQSSSHPLPQLPPGPSNYFSLNGAAKKTARAGRAVLKDRAKGRGEKGYFFTSAKYLATVRTN